MKSNGSWGEYSYPALWAKFSFDGTDGADGKDGTDYEFIFTRTKSEGRPDTPQTYQQDNYLPDQWTDDAVGVTSTYIYEWMSKRIKTYGVWGAFSVPALWSKYAFDGSTGDFFEYRYAVNGSTNNPPHLVVTDPSPEGWSTTMPPVATLEYLWFTVAKKTADGALVTSWSTPPMRVNGIDGQSGAKGDSGPSLVFRGLYEPSETYYGQPNRVDAVEHGAVYYVARADAGTFNVEPPNTEKWNLFGVQYDSVATKLLLAQYANIGGLIMKNNCLVSQIGTVNGVASTDVTDPDFAPNIMIDGQQGQSVFSGSIRSPFAYYDGLWYSNGNMHNRAEKYDNIVIPTKASGSLSFPWTKKCNGRKMTIVNYKWENDTAQGTFRINAPTGKYFYENGLAKSALSFNREVIELIGYGDDNTFFGWIVVGRHGIVSHLTYGEPSKVLFQGEVRYNGSYPIIYASKSHNDVAIWVKRIEQGLYEVYCPQSITPSAGQYTVLLTPTTIGSKNTSSQIYACLVEKGSNHFRVRIADDSSPNDGGFIFQVINIHDWQQNY